MPPKSTQTLRKPKNVVGSNFRSLCPHKNRQSAPYGALCRWLLRIRTERILAIDDADENGDYGEYEQNMNKPADGIDANDAEKPEDEQEDCDSDEHSVDELGSKGNYPRLRAFRFFRGTLAPALRASESPIAIACLRLFAFG